MNFFQSTMSFMFVSVTILAIIGFFGCAIWAITKAIDAENARNNGHFTKDAAYHQGWLHVALWCTLGCFVVGMTTGPFWVYAAGNWWR